MKSKTAFIFVLFNTSQSEIERIGSQFPTGNTYFVDNTNTKKGYAYGVNKGIKQALKDDANIIFIANPDISLENINVYKMIEASAHFDVFGFSFQQDGKTYYGGEVDKMTMNGGLNSVKPKHRFVETDFVSGSFMGIRMEVIEKIGLFDESYGMYYEDVDYCLRATKAGFKVGIDSGIMYTHYEISKSNAAKKWQLASSWMKFLMKYGNSQQKMHEFLRLPRTIYRYITL